jgi:predicted  nucleic acid-binding Zn-ribbon protein
MAPDLKTQLALLKSLQDIDVVLHKIEKELDIIPVKVTEARADYDELINAVQRKETEKANLEKKRKDAEKDAEVENLRIKEREAKLYAIKTNKEYQAAIKEIADAKQANREKEESVIGVMEKINALSEEITQLSSGLADKEKVFKEKEAELRKNENELKTDRDRYHSQHQDAGTKVDPAVLKQYRYIQNKYSDAMALATNGVCSGCNKRIPPQLYIELQKWNELISCTNCHRLLFYQEPQAEEVK